MHLDGAFKHSKWHRMAKGRIIETTQTEVTYSIPTGLDKRYLEGERLM